MEWTFGGANTLETMPALLSGRPGDGLLLITHGGLVIALFCSPSSSPNTMPQGVIIAIIVVVHGWLNLLIGKLLAPRFDIWLRCHPFCMPLAVGTLLMAWLRLRLLLTKC